MASALIRWALSHVEQTQVFQKQILKTSMTNRITEFHLRELPYFVNAPVNKILQNSFDSRYGGIHVVLAPPGSGKTTYLRKYANKYIEDGGHIQYYGSELRSRKDFFLGFGSEARAIDLFSVLPHKSVIILDQFEQAGPKANDDLASLIRHLALESRRTVGNIVIVSTSSLENAEYVLQLNGNDKIKLAGLPLHFKWNSDLLFQFIDNKVFQQWSTEDKNELKKCSLLAECPGYLYSMWEIFPTGPTRSHYPVLHECAVKFQKTWTDFETFQNKHKSAVITFV